jgi:acetylornithine deacetylase/succinyl-diaminopimelate desuccinylase-like protein
MVDPLVAYVDSNFDDYVSELAALVKKPSVSATGVGVDDCARYLVDRIEAYGLQPELFEVEGGHPVIVARALGRDEDRCLLVYDHYDVQPVEPLGKWERDPFSGEISEGKMHGRGTADSKGNLMAYLSAVRALDATEGLPISVKFLLEGDEEIASAPLEPFVNSHRQMLRADATVCCDGDLDPSGRPMISLGMKGLVYVELRCRKARADLHSSKAALVPSAAWHLIEALSTLRDDSGRIAVKGWREGKLEPTPRDMELMERIPFDEKAIKEEMGVEGFLGDAHGIEALKAFLYEPTCNIAGLTSGYQGEGLKTVLPAEARAKLDMRIVYDQRPERCLRLLREHFLQRGFGDIDVNLLGSCQPSHTPPDAPVVRSAAAAAQRVYGRDPVIYPKHHASGPDYLFSKNLGLHSIWTGCPPAHANAHAPNEFIGIEDYRLGIVYAAELIRGFSKS